MFYPACELLVFNVQDLVASDFLVMSDFADV